MAKKGINYATEELKSKLAEDINNSGLPISNVYLILSDLLNQTSFIMKKTVEDEKNTYFEEIQKEESEERSE